MKNWQKHSLFRFLSSLRLAVVSLLSLALVLAVATVLESLYGMRGAHLLVYGRLWFCGQLLVLGLNVFCAALSRWPWKRRHIGFVTTHGGILILLFGSLVTMQFGIDGSLPVTEGSENGEVILPGLRLWVSDPDVGKRQTFPVPESAWEQRGQLLEVGFTANSRIAVDQFLPRVRVERKVEPAPHGMGPPAVHVEVFNNRFTVDTWVVARQPDEASSVGLGPAQIRLQRLPPGQQARFLRGNLDAPRDKKGVLLVRYQGREYRLNIGESMQRWQKLGATGLELKVERYLPYAVVEKNRLVNRGEQPANPAVELRVRSAGGQEEKHTLFANFPDFATLHRKALAASQTEIGVHLRMVAPNADRAVRGTLSFAQTSDERLLYRVTGDKGRALGTGQAEVGKEVATGWMDLNFRVVQWLPASLTSQIPVYVPRQQGSENFPAAIHVRSEGVGDGGETGSWLEEGTSMPLGFGDRILEVTFGRDRLTLPFRLRLNKFTMGTNPGTTKAASYESNVTVTDPAGEGPTARISMNEPLVYGGYTFYQASYQMREGEPPLSVFSVNYDPGRWIKYLGSLTMVLGILLMFYFNPHYWDILLGRPRK